MDLRFIAIPIIGAFIGWITNVLAIKLIFWPYEPLKIPLTNLALHGVIPKRRREIAANIGQIVEENLFSVEDFLLYLEATDTKDKLYQSTLEAVKNTVIDRLPRYVPGPVKDILASLLEEVLEKELPGMLDSLSSNIGSEMRKHVSLKNIIEDRINEFDICSLENIILQVSSRELGHIEIMGGVIGFLIGLVQTALIVFM